MVAERMGVEALCQVSKINGSCHLKMVDAGVSGCYHYYMSDDYPTSWTPTLTSMGQQIANICDSHSGNVACMLQGHTHMDLMKKTDGGIPIFSTTCDKANADSDEIGERASYIYGKRTNGTINEQAFDVVIINKNAKKVSLVRIGAPADNGGGAELEVREQTYA